MLPIHPKIAMLFLQGQSLLAGLQISIAVERTAAVRITRTAAGVDTSVLNRTWTRVDQYSSPALTVVVLRPVGGDRARRSHINLDLHLDLAGVYSPGSRRGLQPRFDLDLDLAGVYSPGSRRGFTAPVLAGVYSPGSNLDSSSGPLNSSSR
jgi:hypothetical protein